MAKPIQGTKLGDPFAGTAGDDTIQGKDGNDVFQASGGNDTIDGGNGIDTVVYSHNFSDYALSFKGTGTTRSPLRTSRPTATESTT